jgi:hypothetical protein
MKQRTCLALMLATFASFAHGSSDDPTENLRRKAYNINFNKDDLSNYLGYVTVKLKGKVCAAADNCQPSGSTTTVEPIRAVSNHPGCVFSVVPQVDLTPQTLASIPSIVNRRATGLVKPLGPDHVSGNARKFLLRLEGRACPAWITVQANGAPGRIVAPNQTPLSVETGPLLALSPSSTAQGVGIFLAQNNQDLGQSGVGPSFLPLNVKSREIDIGAVRNTLELTAHYAQTGTPLQPGTAETEVTLHVSKSLARLD